ncbi:MAG: glycosyl hydrolase family 28-related protein, partial [Pseudomonadota bacterium]
MNKAITEGLDLLPPDFVDGLSVWSSEDGTPGTITYQTNPAGTLVASDPDFGDCLELVTAQSPQRLRYMGETPILPGCYIEVSARVKLVSVTTGIPQVRIATFAGDANGNIVGPVPKTTPLVLLDAFNKVFTIKAIIGSGARTGVDLVWGTEPVYAHVGIDVQGDLGAVVRVESIKVEDKTSIFHRKLMDWVDVLDYGAIGDGVTNDSNAFETADAIAEGRTVIVPAGTYFLDRNVTMLSPVRIEGTITQPANRRLILRSNFDLPTYAAAFGDETLGLKKGIQALFNFADHSTFDLGGRQVDLSEPIDVFSVVGNISSITERRVLSNGLLTAENSNAWDTTTVNASASYSPSDPLVLKNVQNIGTIAVGSLVEGFGVGREVYVREVRTATEEITLSQPLNRAAPNQSYTFKRFKYMLDFSGFERVSSFTLDGVQLDGGRVASGVLLPDDGIWWIFRNCWFTRTGERGISSPGDACQGITIDQCEFLAADAAELVQNRTSVGFNVNKNDAKIRHCRGINLKHFGVLSGNGNLILGNHFWQLDDADPGERTAGLILTDRQSKTTITGNYIDTMFIEFTNEHAPDATDTSNIAFGQVSIVGNIFTATQVADWYKFIVWAPMGNNHRLEGINVMGNTFQLY